MTERIKYEQAARAAYINLLRQNAVTAPNAELLTAGFMDGFGTGFSGGLDAGRIAAIGGLERLMSIMQEPVSVKTIRENAQDFLNALKGVRDE